MTIDKAILEEIAARYPVLRYDPKQMEEDHKRLFLLGGSQRLIILGSTPSWNDGDVCRHRENILDEESARCEYGVEDDEDLADHMSDDPPIGNCDPDAFAGIEGLERARVNLYSTNYRIVLERQDDGTATYTYERWNSEW